MDDVNISRRQLLATMGTAGVTGTLAGSGTATLLSDDVDVLGNTVAAGMVDLRVDWTTRTAAGSSEGDGRVDVAFTDQNRSGSATFSVTLPADESNNPAYGWLRLSCPGERRLSDSVLVDLYYDCGDDRVSLVSDRATTLCEVANELRNGIALDPRCVVVDPGEQACLEPGTDLEIALDWTLEEGYAGAEDVAVTVEFVGIQCRHRDGASNPFADARPASCDCQRGTDVSWVAFGECDDGPLDPADVAFDVSGDTVTLHDAPTTLDTVVLKYGTEIRVFDDPDGDGTFETTDGGEIFQQARNGFAGTDRTNADPCPGCCGLKYESDDGFASPSITGCS